MKTITLCRPSQSALRSPIYINNNNPFVLIAGPCALESHDHAVFMAQQISLIAKELEIPFIFKASYDKANRTSINSPRGVGLEEAIKTFEYIQDHIQVHILTDVHEFWQCDAIAPYVDILQIPAFLSRQTDLIIAAAQTGRVVNVKKAQFVAPWDITHVVEKIESVGNKKILLTDRGTCFGYNTLVSDMRAIPIMQETQYPVIFDATHSVQQPGGQGGTSGGQKEFIFPLARAAIAVGVAGIFMEVHDNPTKSVSDGPNAVPLKDLRGMLKKLKELDVIIKGKDKYEQTSYDC